MSRLQNLGLFPVKFKITKIPLRKIALLELKEALLLEHYEKCAGIINRALRLGAHPTQIKSLLEDPRRNPT